MADDASEIVKETNEVVGSSNLKVTGEGPAFYQNIAYGDQVAHQRAMQMKREQQMDLSAAVMGKLSEMIIHTSPSEGASNTIDLGMLIKSLQTIPPMTAPGPVVP